jgi:DNA invertase Pin-like site-specific DNA recombinase
MLIGYARVLPHDNTLSVQKDALTSAGCRKIFTDTITNAKADRNGLEKALAMLRPGDCLVVWKLDRLGTSIKDTIRIMTLLEEQGIGFKSLTETIDTTARGGKQVYKTFAALRTVLRAKTSAGRRVARAKGRKGGRPKLLTTSQLQELRDMYNNQAIPITEIRRRFHLARSTFYRYVKDSDKQQAGLKGLVHRLRGLGERSGRNL